MATPAVFSALFSGAPGVVYVRGELDGTAVSSLEDALALADIGDHIEVDLTGLEFVDPVGLAGLLRIRQRTVDRGGQLVLVHPRPNVARALAVTGLDVVFGSPLAGDQLEHLNDLA